MGDVIVLYPCPGIGHLVSMVELGKLILKHRPSSSLSILIFMSDAPYSTGDTSSYISHVSSTTPSITFRRLPPVTLPPFDPSTTPMEELGFAIPKLNTPHLHQALQHLLLSTTTTLKALVIDFFCTAALEVSSSLHIPTYYFYTSGATVLCSFLHLPFLHDTMTKSFAEANSYVEIPGSPPIFSSDMTEPWQHRESFTYKEFLHAAKQMVKASGILINTYEALEPKAVEALRLSLCTSPYEKTPPIYCIGPLIASSHGGGGGEEHACLTWLNSQPSQSVVYLSFGSRGTFEEIQLKEIARGLEASEVRFLWVVKSPPSYGGGEGFELDSLMPEGFLERTKERGLVVRNWAPQVRVLGHGAVGGFVTHCGWNSVLESVCAGVPMVAWPLYAEQRQNRVYLVEWGMGLPLEESGKGFVKAEELVRRVREVIDPVEGKAVRDRVAAMRDQAEIALVEGGSSSIATGELLAMW